MTRNPALGDTPPALVAEGIAPPTGAFGVSLSASSWRDGATAADGKEGIGKATPLGVSPPCMSPEASPTALGGACETSSASGSAALGFRVPAETMAS
mmetsp:Transcript_130536/g.365231  ORF Transcript_130536/g.365231 Transcript_130536/m.365231 type:complete len:97 (-) Transcript_130536:154-444(-)